MWVTRYSLYNKTCYYFNVTGADLKSARSASKWTQAEAAQRLGVSQAYLSMVERGSRPMSSDLASAALRVLDVPPTARPLSVPKPLAHDDAFFKKSLGALGYPGFQYLKGRVVLNPAGLLLSALDQEELDARVTEALPWLPYRFPMMNWDWLTREAKLRDRQNRLAYVAGIAQEVARRRGEAELAGRLGERLAGLERSRLANEDTLCKASLSQAERKWLRSHRPVAAAHWHLLTDLKAEDLQHVY